MEHQEDYNKNNEFADLWDLSKDYKPSETSGNNEAWNKMQARIEKEQSQKSTGLSVSYRRLLSYAAVLALFALSGYFFFQPATETPIYAVTESTQNGETRVLSLPDGSEITLASNSTLTYQINSNKRNIELVGHATFEVARNENAPFVVTANDINVTVLGTGFDIDAFPNQDARVYVNHGKVSVENESTQAILVENQGVISSKNDLVNWDKKSNPLRIDKNILRFDNAQLDYVLRTLNNITGMQLNAPSHSNKMLFTGTLQTQTSAEELALILSKALNVSITTKQK